jgi:hypothetical protein
VPLTKPSLISAASLPDFKLVSIIPVNFSSSHKSRGKGHMLGWLQTLQEETSLKYPQLKFHPYCGRLISPSLSMPF